MLAYVVDDALHLRLVAEARRVSARIPGDVDATRLPAHLGGLAPGQRYATDADYDDSDWEIERQRIDVPYSIEKLEALTDGG